MLLSGISAVSLTRSLSRKWMEALRTWVRNSETRKDKKTMIGLPKDPVLLLSVVNTKLRDRYLTLDDLCEDMQADKDEITNKLKGIGYEYDEFFIADLTLSPDSLIAVSARPTMVSLGIPKEISVSTSISLPSSPTRVHVFIFAYITNPHNTEKASLI